MEEKIAKHISNKGLASRLYALNKQTNNNSQNSTIKTQIIQLENAHNMKRYFTEKIEKWQISM